MTPGVRSIAKVLLGLLLAAVITLPVGFVLTILLMPLWSWVEKTFGIESVGHSGPADWCFIVTQMTVFAALAALLLYTGRVRRTP